MKNWRILSNETDAASLPDTVTYAEDCQQKDDEGREKAAVNVIALFAITNILTR